MKSLKMSKLIISIKNIQILYLNLFFISDKKMKLSHIVYSSFKSTEGRETNKGLTKHLHL